MIGDSIEADINGALSSGIDACLYDSAGKHDTSAAKYILRSLREIKDII